MHYIYYVLVLCLDSNCILFTPLDMVCYLDSCDASWLGLWVRNGFTFSNIELLFPFFSFFFLIHFALVWTCLIPLFTPFNSVVEFKDEEFVKKAIETMNKHDLSGRPLNIKEVGTNNF